MKVNFKRKFGLNFTVVDDVTHLALSKEAAVTQGKGATVLAAHHTHVDIGEPSHLG